MGLKVIISVFVVTTVIVSSVNSSDSFDKSTDNEDISKEQLQVGDSDDLTYSESARKLRLIDGDGEQWRAVQRIQNEDDRPLEARPQKRRRLRKRKRRPQQQLGDDQHGEIVRPRRRRPIRLDELDDGWKEMEAESPHRPYSRRRIGPIYQEETSLKFVDSGESPLEREPVLPKGEMTSTTTTTTTEQTTPLKDIKDILKQADGLSLSEILLQNNLTLNDLLRGSQNAILALSERPLQSVTEKQMPDAPAAPISDIRNPTEAEVKRKDDQRKRYSQLYNTQENKLYNEITTKYEVITEATTEKRIFVPSHPKYYTSVNYKPEFDFATEAPKRTTLRLPMTSAQMNTRIKQVDSKVYAPEQIPLADMFNNKVKGTKGPLKMSFDLEELSQQNTILPDNRNHIIESKLDISTTMELVETTTEAIITTPMTTTPTTTTTTSSPTTASQEENDVEVTTMYSVNDIPTSEKLTTTQRFTKKPLTTIKPTTSTLEPKKISVSAKEEIMEIMRNTQDKEELASILISRNMTIDELVEQRERGSSQRHLAEIFHNKTKEPEPTQIIEEFNSFKTIKNLAESNRKPKYITTTTTTTTTTTVAPTQPSSYFEHSEKQLEDVSMSSEEITHAVEKLPSTSFPTYKIETNKLSKEIPPLHIPIWKTIYPSIYIESERHEKKLELDAIEESIRQAVDDDLNEISRSNNNLNEYDDYIQLPIGVKSAIFASLAIVGMSLVLFLTILVVFRWSQKHKKRLCYGGSPGGFTCSKIKSPILQHEPKRTIRTFVSETLGKRRNFYAQQFRQSMSDSWESNERPYQ